MELDEQFLRRAIRLAMNGRGAVEPNPMVGCVIVKSDHVIGEGYHGYVGGPHAEPNALASCSEDPRGATAYVTLEPCCHTNKRTPPCAPRLIAAGISRVVVGCTDPNPDVNGKGLAMLRQAGITVDGPLLENVARQLIAPFLLRINEQRPYVTLKWAMTDDGAVAGTGEKPIRITNERATRVVHELRGRCGAIMVGINTVLTDDPMLNVRLAAKTDRTPIRYVLDRQLRIPVTSRMVSTARKTPTIVACDPIVAQGDRAKELLSHGVEVIPAADFDAVMTDQFSRGITHTLVEPGPTLAKSLLPVADRVWVFKSGETVEASDVPRAPVELPGYATSGTRRLDSNELNEWLNEKNTGFFSLEPSADLELISENGDAA